jgi:hypothetical protein
MAYNNSNDPTKWLKRVLNFTMVRRAARTPLFGWGSLEYVQWLTALECHTIGKVIGRVITAEEVRYDNCGPVFVPLI